tara:strand:+ start:121 stop:435 length:315 start_codon:yes stop_codon:yes gene_type:complete
MNIKDWVMENISPSERKEVLEYGCVNGCVPELIYYRDTCAFYDSHVEEIWDMLDETADAAGQTIMELVASFRGHIGSDDQFKNALTWWAVEETCYQLQAKEDAA